MSGTTEIKQALISRLLAASPGAALTVAQVAWENKNFQPTIGTRWYQATLIPAGSVAAAIGVDAANRHVGVFQVNIFEPVNTGDVLVQAEAERIVTCFKRGTVLTYSGVSLIVERAYRKTARQDGDWFQVPIVIEYRADVAN